MAGDGVNDAPHCRRRVSVYRDGHGADVMRWKSARALPFWVATSWASFRARNLLALPLRNIKQNLFFAFAYNTLGVAIGAGLLYPVHGPFTFTNVAAAAMSLSSVSRFQQRAAPPANWTYKGKRLFKGSKSSDLPPGSSFIVESLRVWISYFFQSHFGAKASCACPPNCSKRTAALRRWALFPSDECGLTLLVIFRIGQESQLAASIIPRCRRLLVEGSSSRRTWPLSFRDEAFCWRLPESI